MFEFLRIVNEFIGILLSPQMVIGAVAVIFFFQFKEDIQALVARIKRAKFPGGEIDINQPIEEDKPLPDVAHDSLPKEQEIEGLRELFHQERTRAYLWEYSYLNYHFIPNTQYVLDWLSSFPAGTSMESFEAA